MSDSEDESVGYGDDFEMDDSGSDDFVVEAPKGKGKKVPAASSKAKAPAKKAAAPKKAPLKSKKNLPNDSVSSGASEAEDMSAVSDAESSKPKVKAAAAAGPQKSASEMYQKLSQLEHVLKRPDSYIGSVEAVTAPMWVFDSASKSMVFRNTTYVPGFFKIFDEILVNAADNKINDPTMDTLKVNIDREKNTISVYNNGKGIPVEMHSKEKIMIPELIFGNLLTSSNYDDDQKKLTGGRNGYGAKLANIYSLEFIVETADKKNMKKYKQVFSNNMGTKGTPKITENKKGEEYTRITFKPDLARFGMTEIDDDTTSLLMKRAYDMAGTVKDIKVFLNDERLKVKGFKQYVEMYLAASANAASEATGGAAVTKPTVIYETSKNGRWEIAFALSDGQMQQVSFANSISTIKGGTHVDMIATQLANKLLEQIKKKNKAAPVKPFQVKNHMWVFVNALVENPAFDSQTKECLTLKSSAFGSKCELSEEFIKKVTKSGIVDNVLNWARFKQDQILKKSDGTKRTRISGIVKLEDANNAGGRNAKLCTLILTEGDSAKSLAVSGLSVVGRDHYGVFPLRGKLLNVREAGHDQIVKNVELQHIKQIMGLKHNHEYSSVDGLRYGKLMIMTDQDHDGSHIKGLIINFLDHFYPSLLKIPGFLVEFITPIVKVWKGKNEIAFYTMPEYEQWKEENNGGKGWDSKYYKGLGTSTAADAKKYFSDLDKHRLEFHTTQEGDRALIDMAFSKKKAEDRKEWLRQYKPGTYLDHDIDILPISDFVNKELILFSMADNIRSIPSVADGLKPGQRKVLFGCFKRNLVKEIKVAQLAGYVSEKTAYHHGEISLTMTIVGLAQNFVGSNNINLLDPNGQFGTRLAGGKDAASARYIFTNVPRITRAIFHPADDALLNYMTEEGMSIEPEYYLPTVPMVLIDGADGIGTGWSTAIPNYNPVDIVDNLRRMMKGEEPVPMTPWYRGFKGSIERIDTDKYKVTGTLKKIDDTTIEITELPVRKWTQDYKEMLEEWVNGTDKVPATLKDYEEHHTDTTVHFRIHMSEKEMKAAEADGLEKRFKISTQISTSNMVCFDLNGKIRKYSSPEEILSDFFHKRVEYYGLRKQHLADELTRQFDRLSNQARFVQMIITKELVVSNKRKTALVTELRELKFKPFPKGKKVKEMGELEPVLEEEEEGMASDYDYLLGMAIWSLTAEKVEKLLSERDEKESELIELLKLSPQDLWNTDLDNFLAEWELMLESDIAANKAIKPKGKAALKIAAKAKKRAKGMDSDDDDSEEDFKPTKATAKPRAKPKPKASPVKPPGEATPNGDVAMKDVKAFFEAKVPAKRPKLEEDDFEMDSPPAKKATAAKASASKPTAKAKAVPKPKPASVVEIDDSDDDMYTVAAPVKNAPAKSKAKAVSLDSDDEVSAPKPTKKAAAKKKTALSDSDVDVPVKKAPAKKTAAKAKPIVDSDVSDAVATPKVKAKKPAAKPAVKPKKAKDESESEFDEDGDSAMDDFVPPPRAMAPRAGRGAAAKKSTYVDLSDLDDDDE